MSRMAASLGTRPPFSALGTAFLTHGLLPQPCVPPAVKTTLTVHHCIMCASSILGMRSPLIQAHAMSAWVVELQSWTHIAARWLRDSTGPGSGGAGAGGGVSSWKPM